MKTFSRILLTVVMAMFIFSLQVIPAKADEPLTTEDFVKREILDHYEVDLAGQTISGEAIVAMWKDDELKDIPFFKIKNAIIDGDVDAEGIYLPFMVQFMHCKFDGNINLESAHTKTFRIDNDPNVKPPFASNGEPSAPSEVIGSLRMGRMIVDGDLGLYESEFVGPVTLFDAKISGNLFARGSRFRGTQWPDRKSKYAFELWTTEVGEATEFSNSTFQGYVMAAYGVFGQDARFDGVTFNDTANFTNFKVGEFANFAKTTFNKDAKFESGVVSRDMQLSGAVFKGAADFNNLSVGRFFNFSKTPLNKDDFDDKTLPNSGAKFLCSVQFNGVHVGKILDFTQAQYEYQCQIDSAASSVGNQMKEPFKMNLAEIEGQAILEEFTSSTGLDLSHSQFGDLDIKVLKSANEENPNTVKLDSTKINGDLYMQAIHINMFSAQDLAVAGSTTFIDLQVLGDLNLSSANLGSFIINDAKYFWTCAQESNTPPSDKCGVVVKEKPIFNLRSTTYTDINFVAVDDEKDGSVISYQDFESAQAAFLDAMVAASEYSPQTYRAFEAFLTEKGRSSAAADLEFARKVRERDEVLVPHSLPWWRSWFLYWFSGYGQVSGFAFVWSMLFIVIATIMFKSQGDLFRDKKEATETEKWLYCFFFSFFLFFSFVVLEFAKDWEPKETGTRFRVYKYSHKMLGLFLAPTAILIFSGLIK